MFAFGDAQCGAPSVHIDISQRHMSACMVRHQRQGFGQLRLGGDEDRSATAQVAGFVSEWRPASFRNSGRHQIGIGGRIASEFASHCDIRKFKGFCFAKMPCETPSFCDKFRMIAYGRCRSLIGSISTENPHYQAVKSGFRRNFSREIPYATFLFRSAALKWTPFAVPGGTEIKV